ncbi:uncharacterized protein DSM5745_03144 [Aspergillus mulundensis]|uniref:Rhodopsin domain-containing protein n=1 Tax=Aspergillus mulundensis TaxID=1810919 RepID=A0A3D8SJQ1_9EURO|nr:Uncharacterized protein DSM5745_03144 [Aspergillus mulundensis]RDW86502.1 Uncharacterized protein DSM5745_03144 [Aspergillus mulundensis]
MPTPAQATLVSNLYEDRGPLVRIHFILMMAAPVVATALRFWSRALMPDAGPGRRKIGRFWWDDWTVLLATLFNIAVCTLAIQMVGVGLGRHAVLLPQENLALFHIFLWAAYIVFIIGATIAKASALLFYARVFTQTHSRLRYCLWTLHALNVAWLLGTLFAVVFMCLPVSKVWHRDIPGHCRSPSAIWLGSGISGVFIDVLILVLPIPIVWGLQMKPCRKFLAVLVIILGHLVVVVSIGRLASVAETAENLALDPTYKSVTPIFWHGSEIPIAVINVSLPSIFLLVRRAFAHGVPSVFTVKHFPSSARVNDSQLERADLRPSGSGSSIQLMTARPIYTHKLTKSLTSHSGFTESITALPQIPEESVGQQTPALTPEHGSTTSISSTLPHIPEEPPQLTLGYPSTSSISSAPPQLEETQGRRTPQLTLEVGSPSPIPWGRATEARLSELSNV